MYHLSEQRDEADEAPETGLSQPKTVLSHQTLKLTCGKSSLSIMVAFHNDQFNGINHPTLCSSSNDTNHLTPPSISFCNSIIGFLQLLWMRSIRDSEPQSIYILGKRNYKLYYNIAQTVRVPKRLLSVLDTGSSSSFVKLCGLPEALKAKFRKLDNILDVRNASGKSVSIVGTIERMVQICKST